MDMNIGLYGELPSNNCVFAACDSKYFLEHATAFVKSADEVGKHAHLHIVNPTEEVFSLCVILEGITKVNTTYSFNDVKLPEEWNDENIRAYYACLRFLVAPFILPAAGKLMILDIDSLIMENFQYPFSDFGYYPREPLPGTVGWENEGTRVAAGAIFYNNTENGKNVSLKVYEEITKTPMNWFIDQIALNRVFKTQEEISNITYFDNQFMDWEFIEGTTIWTGKGPRKYDNPTYVNEKEMKSKLDFSDFKNIILKPRLDIIFKKGLVKRENGIIQPYIRNHWNNFVLKKKAELDSVLVFESPKWMFNNTIQNYFSDDCKMYVPHVEKHNWEGNDNTLYYMQTVFPWLFTVDPKGWAGGAEYVDTFKFVDEYADDAFNEMREYTLSGKSKFKQPTEKAKLNIGKSKGNPFIFVPLQLPHDETIKWHSDVGVVEMIQKLCDWSKSTPDAPKILFKIHPANESVFDHTLNGHIDNFKCFSRGFGSDEISIQQIIPEAEAVYVINSGVGQEAMLYDVPVVAFGEADYSPAVIKGKIDDLDFTWDAVLHDDKEKRKSLYRKWYDWFINRVTIDSNA